MRRRATWRILVLGLLPGLPIHAHAGIAAEIVSTETLAAVVADSGKIDRDQAPEESRGTVEERIELDIVAASSTSIAPPTADRHSAVELGLLPARAPPAA